MKQRNAKMELNRIEDMYLYGDRCVYLENEQGELFLTNPIVNITPGSVVCQLPLTYVRGLSLPSSSNDTTA